MEVLGYNYKHNVTNHKVIFTEALARWRDSSGVFIPPNTFLQIAKESGLSDVLDEYLLDAVFGEYVKLRAQSEYRETMLTINLMPSSFLSQRFVDFLKKSMKKHSLNPENIMIEISEKTFVNDLTICILFIEKYKKDGFKIAIDDFGSEYSALNILGRISYDVLKLEGNFGMNTLSDVNETIVRMVKSITDLTDKKIVVEGVETAEQSEKLANLGCIYQQGYYHHRPSKLT